MKKGTSDELSIPQNKIVDFLDGVFRDDTEEERLRQEFEKKLVREYLYPRENIVVDYVLQLESGKKKISLAVLGDQKGTDPENIYIVIECKKEEILPDNPQQGVESLKTYLLACPQSQFGVWTNGTSQIFYQKTTENSRPVFKEIVDMSRYRQTLGDAETPKRDNLKIASGQSLKFAFERSYRRIIEDHKFKPEEALKELLKVICAKLFDEESGKMDFFETNEEWRFLEGQLKISKRVNKTFQKALASPEYRGLFDPAEKIQLDSKTLSFIVGQLQHYSLLQSSAESKSLAYEKMMKLSLLEDKEQPPLPRSIEEMIVRMVNPKIKETVADLSCGFGGFLVAIAEHIGQEAGENPNLSEDKSLYAENRLYGCDLSHDLIRAARINLLLHNHKNPGNIFHADLLTPRESWSKEAKLVFGIGTQDSLEKFDAVITSALAEAQVAIDDPFVLEQFELGYIWEKGDKDQFIKTKKLQKSVSGEVLFIERCLELLKPNGRIAIILRDTVLGAPNFEYVRSWVLEKTQVIASLSLNEDSLQLGNGLRSSVLILRKKSQEEIALNKTSVKTKKYPVFMAIVEHSGYNKSGRPIYEHDESGNDILRLRKETIKGQVGDQATEKEIEVKDKVLHDEMPEITQLFSEWKDKYKLNLASLDF